MSDPTTLIPNLNEIMEGYTELENQIEQVSRAASGQVEERDDENEKNQHIVEESRKKRERMKLKQNRGKIKQETLFQTK